MDEQDRLGFLEKYGFAAESWIYGSPCRPLHSSWFRVERAILMQVNPGETGHYTYVVMPGRLAREELDAHELVLVSRPAR